MKIVMTVQLQQDNGTPVVTGQQSLPNFTGADIETVRSFLTSIQMSSFTRMLGWIADGIMSLTGTPTITINSLK